MIRKTIKLILPSSLLETIRDFILLPNKINAVIKMKKWRKKDIEKATHRHEFKIFSQNGEDGIIYYIFNKIGTKNRYFVEIGSGTGVECNTANLSLNNNWRGILIDGNKENIERGNIFYKTRFKKKPLPVKLVHSFVTKENINKILSENGAVGKIDLLSIDIDGNDYWVWKAIKVIDPRVVVIEYNASLGYDKSLTVEYDPDFDRFKKHSSGWYHGASLSALTKLANSKGYILAGCNSDGVNAFFIKKEIAKENFSEMSPKDAYFPCSYRNKKLSPLEQFNLIKGLNWVKIC